MARRRALLTTRRKHRCRYRPALRQRGIPATIPQRDDQKAQRRKRGSAGGRPPAFDAETYKQRNVVERCINGLKQWRGIATRYDKHAVNYRSALVLASMVLWTRA